MKVNPVCIFVLILLALLNGGCEKSATISYATKYKKLKLYDDKIEDPRYCGMRIVAGKGRFFMTYGYWNEQNRNWATPPSASRNQWMVTDQEGNLIRKDSLPSGYTMGDVLALNDNSFIVVIYDNEETSSTYHALRLYRFDQNGQKISDYSLVMPPDIQLQQKLLNVRLFPSVNGNALLSFHHHFLDAAGTYDFGFIGEMDLNGNFLWHKKYTTLSITGCLITSTGDYLFTGSNDAMSIIGPFSFFSNRVFLFKTNSVGDSLAYHHYKKIDYDFIECGNVIPAGNGNYRFCFSPVITNDPSQQFFKGYIYEVTANLDSVNATTLYIQNRNIIETILPTGNGGVFALMNSTNQKPLYSGGVFYDFYYGNIGNDQLNSRRVTLDGNLNTSGMRTFQDEETDLFRVACQTPEGNIACFGLIQNHQRDYYKPALILLSN